MDRVQRRGREGSTKAYNLLAKDSVEHGVRIVQEEKRNDANYVMGDMSVRKMSCRGQDVANRDVSIVAKYLLDEEQLERRQAALDEKNRRKRRENPGGDAEQPLKKPKKN